MRCAALIAFLLLQALAACGERLRSSRARDTGSLELTDEQFLKIWVPGLNDNERDILIREKVRRDIIDELTSEDLTGLGLKLGARKRILKAVRLRNEYLAFVYKWRNEWQFNAADPWQPSADTAVIDMRGYFAGKPGELDCEFYAGSTREEKQRGLQLLDVAAGGNCDLAGLRAFKGRRVTKINGERVEWWGLKMAVGHNPFLHIQFAPLRPSSASTPTTTTSEKKEKRH